MFRPEAILTMLDSRSFGSVWFWVLLALAWTLAGRRVAGVPVDVIAAASRAARDGTAQPAALALLDWLSLTLPRWRVPGADGAVILGVSAFALTTLALLGFVYDLEMARALVLLLLPLGLAFALELRLARRLRTVLAEAEQGAPVDQAAARAAAMMRRHRLVFTLLSIVDVAIAAFQGALWMLRHPFGF